MARIKNSNAYKDAYIQAQRLLNVDPDALQELISGDNLSSTQRQAYSDLMSENIIEKDLSRNQSRRALFEKYGQKFTQYETRHKEKTRFKDR